MDFPKSVSGVGLVGGVFVDENPVLGTKGSLIPSAWGNAVTQEILAVLAAAGVAPVEGDNDQMAGAIASLIVAALGNVATPPQFDNDKSAVNSEFVQRALGNMSGFSSYSANAALPVSDAGKYIAVSGGTAFTLPGAGAVAIGTKFTVAVSGAAPSAITISIAGGGTISGINNNPSAPSMVMQQGTSCEFVLVASGVYAAINGSGLASLSANGYQKLANGLIIQWGTALASVAGSPVTFPISFPNQQFVVLAGGASGTGFIYSLGQGLSGFNFHVSAGATANHFWMAIGR